MLEIPREFPKLFVKYMQTPWQSIKTLCVCLLLFSPVSCLPTALTPHSNHSEGLDFSLTSMSFFGFVTLLFTHLSA